MRRIIVCGSRGWADRKVIADTLAVVGFTISAEPVVIVHGKCRRGADFYADEVARELGFDVEHHPADWGLHGKRAGFIRNEEMAALGAELCIAFWDGLSNGTRDMMDRARKHGISVMVVS